MEKEKQQLIKQVQFVLPIDDIVLVASVWMQAESLELSVSFRCHRRKEGTEIWEQSDRFGKDELPAFTHLAQLAHEWIENIQRQGGVLQ